MWQEQCERGRREHPRQAQGSCCVLQNEFFILDFPFPPHTTSSLEKFTLVSRYLTLTRPQTELQTSSQAPSCGQVPDQELHHHLPKMGTWTP